MTKLTLHAALAVVVLGAAALTLTAQSPVAAKPNPTVVVGTFDSRAVAMAYVRSEAFSKYLQAQRTDVNGAIARAKAAGDAAMVADLEALGPAMQKRIHQQGFSTAPVDDLLAVIEDRLPGIAEAAGVDVIVSKWTLTYRRPGAGTVDVTERLAAAFEPDEATLQAIRDIVKTDPVPLDDLPR